MENIWSNKKTINTIINVLLFLLATNFLHYGQLFLPLICLIIFIDNKCKFRVNSYFIFSILCLLSISIFIFAGDLGFYRVIGFCFPMAYYIGSNMRTKNENAFKELILAYRQYLLACHFHYQKLTLRFQKLLSIYMTVLCTWLLPTH